MTEDPIDAPVIASPELCSVGRSSSKGRFLLVGFASDDKGEVPLFSGVEISLGLFAATSSDDEEATISMPV